jgi:RNA polymerase sigma factor (sigma-70 family)
MIIGKGTQLTEKELVLLLKEYYCANSEERRDQASELLPYMEPLVIQVTKRYENTITDLEDLQQYCRLKLYFALDKWQPDIGESIEGFFRKVCVNGARDYLQTRNEREFSRLQSYDADGLHCLIDNYSGEYIVHTEVPLQGEVFADLYVNETYNAIYQEALTLLIEYASKGDSQALVARTLESKYSETSAWRVHEILQNAKVTLREHYLDHAPKLDLDEELEEIDNSVLFKRLAKYLTDVQLRDIVAVFGGCIIRVPHFERINCGTKS